MKFKEAFDTPNLTWNRLVFARIFKVQKSYLEIKVIHETSNWPLQKYPNNVGGFGDFGMTKNLSLAYKKFDPPTCQYKVLSIELKPIFNFQWCIPRFVKWYLGRKLF